MVYSDFLFLQFSNYTRSIVLKAGLSMELSCSLSRNRNCTNTPLEHVPLLERFVTYVIRQKGKARNFKCS